MIRLTESDSVPRVEDAVERHMRLCLQNLNAEKYKAAILPLYNNYGEKINTRNEKQKEVNFAQDLVWLNDGVLDNVLRDLNGRAREFDRNNPGSNTTVLLFPRGNVSGIVTMPDKEEPDAAHSIAQKLLALGEQHELYPYAAKIEEAVAKCREALAQHVTALQNLGDAKTALAISKNNLVRQYNAGYFAAANDVDKAFAERLYPRLRSSKKRKSNKENHEEENQG